MKVVVCNNCGTKHFKGFYSCDNRWCLNCAHKRMICYLARLIPIFQDWYENGNFVSMLNFTVRDGSPLSEPLNLLETSFRELYHGHNERRGYWKERFPGGIRSAEIKLGANSRKPHPHYHCLVMQEGGKEFVKDYYWTSEAWHSIVGLKTYDARLFCDGSIIQLAEETTRKDGTPDYNWNGNIFIKKVSEKSDKNGKGGILAAVCETLKYIIKVDKMVFGDSDDEIKDMDFFKEAYWTMKGKRQTSTWGLLFGINEKQIAQDMKEDVEKKVDFICQRCGCTEGTLIDMLYRSVGDSLLLDIPKEKGKKITSSAKEVIQQQA